MLTTFSGTVGGQVRQVLLYHVFLYKSTDISEQSAAFIVVVEMHSSILFYSDGRDHMFV